jgi:hypothetical protein
MLQDRDAGAVFNLRDRRAITEVLWPKASITSYSRKGRLIGLFQQGDLRVARLFALSSSHALHQTSDLIELSRARRGVKLRLLGDPVRFNSYTLFTLTALPLTLLTASAFGQEDPGDTPDSPAPGDDVESEEDEEAPSEEAPSEEVPSGEAPSGEDVEEPDAVDNENATPADAKPGCAEGEDCAEKKPDPEKKIELDEEDDESESVEVEAEEVPQPKTVQDTEHSEGADADKIEEAAEAALTEAPPKGDSLWPMKFTTSTWSRFEVRENYDSLGVSSGRTQEGDLIVFRSRVGMRTNPLPVSDTSDVSVQFTPQATGHWGQDGTVGDAAVGIYEGYVAFRSKRLDVQLGRIMMNYGDAAVIGNLDWNEKGRSFDGIRAHYKMDKGYFDVFGTQIYEAHPGGSNKFLGGDQYFWGIYTGIGGYAGSGDEDIDIDLYFLGLTGRTGREIDDGQGGLLYQKGATLFTFGARGRGDLGPVDIRAEAGLQFGHVTNTTPDPDQVATLEPETAFAYMGELEFGLPLGSKTRVSLGGIIASGDVADTQGDGAWNQLFPTGHKFLGLMDVIGARSNVGSGNLKFSRKVTEQLTFKTDGHIFARMEDTLDGQAKGLSGIEVDTQLVQNLGKYAYVRGLYGLFIPSSGHYASDDLVSYGEVQAGVDF